MPTTYTDQFWLMDPANPPAVGTTLNVFSFDIVDQNDNSFISQNNNDSVDGSDISQSYPGDTVTVDLPGGGSTTILRITFYLADGRVVFTPSDGRVLQASTFVSSTFVTGQGPLPAGSVGPPCSFAVAFERGLVIRTNKRSSSQSGCIVSKKHQRVGLCLCWC